MEQVGVAYGAGRGRYRLGRLVVLILAGAFTGGRGGSRDSSKGGHLKTFQREVNAHVYFGTPLAAPLEPLEVQAQHLKGYAPNVTKHHLNVCRGNPVPVPIAAAKGGAEVQASPCLRLTAPLAAVLLSTRQLLATSVHRLGPNNPPGRVCHCCTSCHL
eukprot:8462511-Pyramimonas_sp.AAC.1